MIKIMKQIFMKVWSWGGVENHYNYGRLYFELFHSSYNNIIIVDHDNNHNFKLKKRIDFFEKK
jgi:hypothetical protein